MCRNSELVDEQLPDKDPGLKKCWSINANPKMSLVDIW